MCFCALDDLKRLRQIHRPRDAGEVALDLGIGRQPLLEVRLLLRGGGGQIRQRSALDDAEPWNDGILGAEREDATRGGRMALDVPLSFVERLPDSVQVGFAVSRSRGAIGRLSGPGYDAESDRECGGDDKRAEPGWHLRTPLRERSIDARGRRFYRYGGQAIWTAQ